MDTLELYKEMENKGQKKGHLFGSAGAVLVGIASAFHIYGSTDSFSTMRNRLRKIDCAYSGLNSDYSAMLGDWHEVTGDVVSSVAKVHKEQNGR